MNQNPSKDVNNAGKDSNDVTKKQTTKNQKLRALLDGLDLTPEQTSDDVSKPINRDTEILGDVPPHHGK